MDPALAGGYWGDITASIDWCETNYELTPYIAEFFNSWSSLAMVILGEACAYMNPTGHKGFTALGHSITVVGLGSWLFHATLKYSMQMADELPMIWAIAISLYLAVTMQFKSHQMAFKWGLISWTAFTTVMTACTSGKLEFVVFQTTFNLFSIAMVYMTWRAKRDLERADMPEISRLFFHGLKWYALAGTVWLIDTNLCQYINGHDSTSVLPFNMQLHAWWHVFASL
ncbi:alkaline ceramidase ydc1, partial [Linderina pennispora]